MAVPECWFCPELAQVLLTTVEKTSHSPHSWLDTHCMHALMQLVPAAAQLEQLPP